MVTRGNILVIVYADVTTTMVTRGNILVIVYADVTTTMVTCGNILVIVLFVYVNATSNILHPRY